MRRILIVMAVFVLAACSSDSSLPTPTGKGTIRAINAIKSSPTFTFLIEERLLETLAYKTASSAQRYDDFSYTFNFEALLPGDSSLTRVARPVLKVDANRDYTFVLTGDVSNPTITVWEDDERTFGDAETVFEMRFAHTAPALGMIDVYFAAPGVAPVVGEERGTLSFGEILPGADFEAGDYVITFTSSGDPTNVLYQSEAQTYVAQNSSITPIFEGDELDVAPYNVRLLNVLSGVTSLPDARFSPTIRFIQASFDLADADVYDDEMLTSQVLANHLFGDITDDMDIQAGVTQYTYTAAGNPGAVLFESGISIVAGTRNNFVVIGDDSNRNATTYVPDRRSVSTLVNLRLFHAALNHDRLDIYVVDAGQSIDPDAPALSDLAYSLLSPVVSLAAGSFDLYLTPADDPTILAGPLRIDPVLGDVVEIIVLDTVDPTTAEMRILPTQ